MKSSVKFPLLIGAALIAGSASFAQAQTQSGSAGQPQEKMAQGGPKSASAAAAKPARTDVIQFKRGQASLTEQDKAKLRKAIDDARAQGEIDQVNVVAWADKPFPKGQNADLSDADKKLADQRKDVVENFLEDELKVGDVETFSMAEQANWFARAFNTEDAELKSLFGQQGAPAVTQEDFKAVKSKGGTSKTVVLIEMKKPAASATGSDRAM